MYKLWFYNFISKSFNKRISFDIYENQIILYVYNNTTHNVKMFVYWRNSGFVTVICFCLQHFPDALIDPSQRVHHTAVEIC